MVELVEQKIAFLTMKVSHMLLSLSINTECINILLTKIEPMFCL